MRFHEIHQPRAPRLILEAHRGRSWQCLKEGDTRFFRCPLYRDTYRDKILPDAQMRARLSRFMNIKRQMPTMPVGTNDKFVQSDAPLGQAIPKLRKAHLDRDLSIVYRVTDRGIYLYGIFSHDELGTAGNIRQQKSMAQKLSHQVCA